MIRVDYSKDFAAYTLALTDFSFGDGTTINMKFDTGAVKSVISIWALFQRISINQIDNLRKGFEFVFSVFFELHAVNETQISNIANINFLFICIFLFSEKFVYFCKDKIKLAFYILILQYFHICTTIIQY